MQDQLEEISTQGCQWSGIKRLKKKFTPFYTKFCNREDAPNTEANFPKEAARHLAEVQWKTPDGEIAPTPSSLSNAGSNVKSTSFEIYELDHALAQLKIKKTPGPDQIPTEFLKWLDDDNRKFVLQHYELR